MIDLSNTINKSALQYVEVYRWFFLIKNIYTAWNLKFVICNITFIAFKICIIYYYLLHTILRDTKKFICVLMNCQMILQIFLDTYNYTLTFNIIKKTEVHKKLSVVEVVMRNIQVSVIARRAQLQFVRYKQFASRYQINCTEFKQLNESIDYCFLINKIKLR